MLQKISTGLAIIAAIIVAIFSIQNLNEIEVTFLTWAVSVPKIVVILGSYLLGMLTGGTMLHMAKRYFFSQRKASKAAEKPTSSAGTGG